MTGNKMPDLDIVFKGLGTSAVDRGKNGSAVLIVIDETTPDYFVKYKSIDDFTSEEQDKFTPENVKFIKDALEGTPLELYVSCAPTPDNPDLNLSDTLKSLGGRIPRNSWVGIASSVQQDHEDLCTWVKSQRKNNKKRYKGLVYKAITTDDIGIVNLTTTNVIEASDTTKTLTGDKAVPFLLGYLAGLPLTMSAIAKPLSKYSWAEEPDDLDVAIGNGEFVLFNDESIVKVARGVNSLVTLTDGVIPEMTFINTVEKMDLIYCDIYKAWDESYKGKYSNELDNQQLLISAINAYFKLISLSNILDKNFDNYCEVDILKQRIANYPKYGQDVVDAWTDTKALQMTYSTKVFFRARIKIPGIMEDFYFDIFF